MTNQCLKLSLFCLENLQSLISDAFKYQSLNIFGVDLYNFDFDLYNFDFDSTYCEQGMFREGKVLHFSCITWLPRNF